MISPFARPRNRFLSLVSVFFPLDDAGSQMLTFSHKESHSLADSHTFSQKPFYCRDFAYCLCRLTRRTE